MGISQLGCWMTLCFTFGRSEIHWWIFTSCSFYWLWAVKNRIAGPLRTDIGVFTFFPGIALVAYEVFIANRTAVTTIGCALSCALILVHWLYAVKVFGYGREGFVEMAQKVKKSPFWGRVMFYYSYSHIAFWATSIVMCA